MGDELGQQHADVSPEGRAGRTVVRAVRYYQTRISPHVDTNCRYEPSCSQYMILAVDKYGALSGSWRGVKRIVRCRPGAGRSGVDYP